MGLEFTDIPDREGAAIYYIHHGSHSDETFTERLRRDIQDRLPDSQVVSVSVRTPDGEKIRDFYDILPERLPALLIVRDDDSLAGIYGATDMPPTDQLAYMLRSIG